MIVHSNSYEYVEIAETKVIIIKNGDNVYIEEGTLFVDGTSFFVPSGKIINFVCEGDKIYALAVIGTRTMSSVNGKTHYES